MEAKHFSSKLKSSFIITLIFSYVDVYNEAKIILRSLCKNGSQFIVNNDPQLKFFCAKYSPKIEEYLQMNNLMFLSPRVSRIQSLELYRYTAFKQLLTNFHHVKFINNLKLSGATEELNVKYVKEQLEKDGFARILDISQSIDISESYYLRPMKDMDKRFISRAEGALNLGIQLDNCKAIQELKQLDNLKGFKVTNATKFPRILQYFMQLSSSSCELNTFQIDLKQKMSIQIEEFLKILPILKNLTQLQLPLKYFQIQSHVGQFKSFTKLQILKLKVDRFDMFFLSFWPMLTKFSLTYYQLLVNSQNKYNFKKLQYISLANYNTCQKRKYIYDKATLEEEERILKQIGHISKVKLSRLSKITGFYEQAKPKLLTLELLEIQEFSYQIFEDIATQENLRSLKLRFAHLKDKSKLDLKPDYEFSVNISIEQIELELLDIKLDEVTRLAFITNLCSFLNSLKNVSRCALIDDDIQEIKDKSPLECIARFQKIVKLTVQNFNQQKVQRICQVIFYSNLQLQELDLQIYLGRARFENLISLLGKLKQLRTFKVKALSQSDISQTIILFFQVVKFHPKLKNLKIEFYQERFFYSYHAQNFLFQLEELIVKTCKNLKELRLPIRNLPEDLTKTEPEYLKLKKAFISNVTAQLPNLDVLII